MEPFPHEIINFEERINNNLLEKYLGQPNGFVQVGPEKFVLFAGYKDFADTIYNFEARADDVFVCTHPRSGTTWTQEMVWLICNDLNYETARGEVLNKRFPYLERHLWANDLNVKSSPNLFNNTNLKGMLDPIYNELAKQKTRRFLKTHFPITLLPQNATKVGAKIIYVARNPKDVAVSFYHLHKMHPFLRFDGDFDLFIEYFMNGWTVFGSYWEHVLSAWRHRNDENILFIFYENLKLETEQTLRKLSNFLGKPLSDDQLPALMKHLEFDNFKSNPSVNYKLNEQNPENSGLVRRGKIGGNPEMSNEISKRFDDWIKENLKDSDLQFPHCSG